MHGARTQVTETAAHGGTGTSTLGSHSSGAAGPFHTQALCAPLKPRHGKRSALTDTARRTPMSGAATSVYSARFHVGRVWPLVGELQGRPGGRGGAGHRWGARRPRISIWALVPRTPVCHKPPPCTLTSVCFASVSYVAINRHSRGDAGSDGTLYRGGDGDPSSTP